MLKKKKTLYIVLKTTLCVKSYYHGFAKKAIEKRKM